MKRGIGILVACVLASCNDRGSLGDGNVGTGSSGGVHETTAAEAETGPSVDEPCPDGCLQHADDIVLPAPHGGWRLHVGDFDGDGWDDLADFHGFVLFGDPVAPFQTFRELELDDEGPVVLAAADIDGDGRTDLVARRGYGALLVVLGVEDRSFGDAIVAAELPVRGIPFVGDFDGDGLADLALPSGITSIEILRGRTDGTLSVSGAIEVPVWEWVTGGHIDDDGHIDLLVPEHGMLRVLFGRGDGSFEEPVEFLENPGTPEFPLRSPAAVGLVGVAVAACSRQELDFASCGMRLLHASTTRTPEMATLVDLYHHTVGLEVGDFRGDGRGSIVAHAYGSSPSRSVLKLVCATEHGVYGVCDEIELAEHISAFTALDVDGDGLDDVVIVDNDAPTMLRVLLARP